MKRQRRTNCFEGAEEEGERGREGRERWKISRGKFGGDFQAWRVARASRQSTRSLSGDTEKPWFTAYPYTCT